MLLVAAFAATLVLLLGGWALLGRDGAARPSGGAATATQPPASRSPSSRPNPSAPPATAPGPGSSGEPPTVVLTGAGDIGQSGLDGARLTSDILVRETGWIYTAGDNAYDDGSAAAYRDCYAPTWGRVLDRTILPAPGNHDWSTDGAAGYRDYFGAAAAPVSAPDGATWYSRDIGAWHVIVLDSDCAKVGGCGPDSEQGLWLAADLAASDARCTLAIWHHPRFSSGQHGDAAAVAPFWEMLHAGGADLIVNGHDHDYERFAPQDPSGREERPGGIREIVVGTGGADLRGFRRAAPNSEFRLAGAWGVLRLTLRPANYEWEFLPATGTVADSGSTPCH